MEQTPRTMLSCFSVVVLLVLQLGRVDGTCDLLKAQQCQLDSYTQMLKVNCQSAQLVTDLQNCVNPNIDTCIQTTKDYWATQISTYQLNLYKINADPATKCEMNTGVCVAKTTELAAITACTTNLATNIAKIKDGGPKGENVSASCTIAQTAVTCLQNLSPTCSASMTEKSAQLATYTNVEGYCTKSTTINPESEGLNTTVLVIIITLAILIVIVNVILVIIWLYNRRQKARDKRMPAVRGPMVTRPVQYY